MPQASCYAFGNVLSDDSRLSAFSAPPAARHRLRFAFNGKMHRHGLAQSITFHKRRNQTAFNPATYLAKTRLTFSSSHQYGLLPMPSCSKTRCWFDSVFSSLASQTPLSAQNYSCTQSLQASPPWPSLYHTGAAHIFPQSDQGQALPHLAARR